MVGDHAVANRLAREDPFRLGDDGAGPRQILWTRLEQDDVVRHFNGQRVVGAVDTEDAFRQLLRRRGRRRCSTSSRRAGLRAGAGSAATTVTTTASTTGRSFSCST